MLNKVTLIGRLGADPEVRYMPNGGAVTNVRLATNRVWTDRQSGQRQEETEWHRVVFFTRLAEIAGEYLKKGSLAYIEGRIRTQKWQDQSGQDRYTTEIVAEQLKMLDSKSGGTGQFNEAGSGNTQPAYSSAAPASSPTSPAGGANQPPAQPAPQTFDDFDDDIPF